MSSEHVLAKATLRIYPKPVLARERLRDALMLHFDMYEDEADALIDDLITVVSYELALPGSSKNGVWSEG